MSDDDEFEVEHMPFQKHGIQWLSASSLNTFKNSPARWILSYLAGMKDAPNAAMSRGIVLEMSYACWKYAHPLRPPAAYESAAT